MGEDKIMNTWNYIIIEAYCFADTEQPPCGKGGTSGFCLQGCPYFGHADATSREAATDVPLCLILWDKLCERADGLYWNLRWYLWDKWHYDDSWLDNMSYDASTDSLEAVENRNDAETKFRLWLNETEKRITEEIERS